MEPNAIAGRSGKRRKHASRKRKYDLAAVRKATRTAGPCHFRCIEDESIKKTSACTLSDAVGSEYRR